MRSSSGSAGRASPVLRLDTSEIPFSMAALQALRGTTTALGPPSFYPHHSVPIAPTGPAATPPPLSATTALLGSSSKGNDSAGSRRAARYNEYGERVGQLSKIGFLILAIVFVVFVGVVVTLISMVFVRVNHVLDRVDGSEITGKLDKMLDHAMNSAMNTEAATATLAQAADVAHGMTLDVRPRLAHALNSTSDMIDHVRDFSFHPKWTISAGSTVGGG